MRLQIGEPPTPAAPSPDPESWTRIAGPSSGITQVAAWAVGIAAMTVMVGVIIVSSLARAGESVPSSDQGASLLIVVTVLLITIPVHELVHAIFYPGGAFSPRITYLVWPRRVRFGVYYEGTLSRERWLVARTAPFMILAVLPLAILVVTGGSLGPGLVTAISILLLCNALGSGGDLLGAAWVFIKIPQGSILGFFSAKAYLKRGSVTHV